VLRIRKMHSSEKLFRIREPTWTEMHSLCKKESELEKGHVDRNALPLHMQLEQARKYKNSFAPKKNVQN